MCKTLRLWLLGMQVQRDVRTWDPGGLGPGRYKTWRMWVLTSSYFWQEELWPNLAVASPAEMMSPQPQEQLLEGNSSFTQ